MNTAYLGLGSNIGHRDRHLSTALTKIHQLDSIDIVAVSSQYETKAVASFPQPDFINMVVKINTLLTPVQLLDETELIERQMGRQSKGTGDPRVIDIDILLYNSDIISSDRLIIPHPLMHERMFVLEPLVEIGGQCVHPMLNATMTALKDQCHVS